MPHIQVPAASAALSADGSKGYVTVADSTPYYPGCFAYLSDDGTAGSQRVLITGLGASGIVYLRFVVEVNQGYNFQKSQSSPQPLPSPNYGNGDCTAWTTDNSARLSMWAQLAPVDANNAKRLSIP
jgi:hypothetical protein